MLKARHDHELWLVQQPDHAQLSGYLAAHWGGANGFAMPGHYPGSTDPRRWRDEVVLGIAEHDNGWWETEAMPRISERDGLPVGVGEAAPASSENELSEWSAGGFDRWRRGINRLAGSHPYGALLVSMHAYWLYAVSFDDLAPLDADARRHFVFGPPQVAAGLIGDRAVTRAFIGEQAELQDALMSRLRRDPGMAGAVEPEHLDPHFRLLQLMDTMSLYLALHDTDDHLLPGVPRGGGSDRVEMTWKRLDERTIALSPYPFGTDRLVVSMPTRVVSLNDHDETPPLSRLHGTGMRAIEFVFTSG